MNKPTKQPIIRKGQRKPKATRPPAKAAALLHRSRFRGWILTVVGALLLFVALAGWLAVRSAHAGALWGALLGGLSAGIGVIGSMLFLRGKQHLTRSAREQLASDTRAPVIYLRSFAADSETAEAEQGNQPGLGGWVTEEEQLAAVLNQVGPVIAVGRPGEDLPEIGAARLYVADEEWQERVQELLGRARLVVLRLGTSKGLLWELRSVLAAKDPRQVLLVVPSAKEAYDEFRQGTAEILPHPLPCLLGWKEAGKSRVRALIGFEENWVPVLQDLALVRGSMFRNSVGRALQSTLQYAVQPFFDRLGVPWRRPPVGGMWYFLGAIALIIVSMVALALIMEEPSSSHWKPYVDDVAGTDVLVSADPNPLAGLDERILALPGMAERLRGATNFEQGVAVGREFSSRGLRRLGDRDLLERLRLLAALFAGMTDQECVAFRNGTVGDADTRRIFGRLPRVDVQLWMELIVRATKAELENNPAPRTIDAKSRELAVTALRDRFDPGELSVWDTLVHPEAASDADLARALRRYYAHALELADEPRRALALAEVVPATDER